MSTPKENSGAKAAFRGFRIQTTYILYRILTQKSNQIFIPEGEEDLLITKNDGHSIEVIQVKNYTSPLTLSNLSPEKNDAFINRSIKLLENVDKPKIKLVSFGQLGDELEKYRQSGNSESISKKLLKKYSKEQIKLLFNYWQIEVLEEQDLRKKIETNLKEHLTGIDWETAFELLMYWLYIASEEKLPITKDLLLSKIQSIAQFISDKYSFLTQFGTSIIDIANDNQNIEQRYLENEFYNGAAAKYAHIKANLDVLRTSKLQEVQGCFHTSNLTIIHGASGQGKSALCYRYIYEYYPAGFAFQVKHFEYSDLKDIISTLKTLSKPFEKPFLIYIDVLPNNYHWVELANELTLIENCQILISIREEDLNRSPKIEEWTNPTMLQLNFFREEAKEVFDSFEKRNTIEKFLDFDEAWQTFGGEGPLLEFAYLVNQGKKLEFRLKNQINNLKEIAKQNKEWEQVELLKLVTLANRYDCRVDLNKVIKQVNLKDYGGTLQWFQDEYLFRISDDGNWLEGLHPIRSTLIANLLYDFVVENPEDIFQNLIQVIKEDDLGLLLLHYFADFNSYKFIIESITNYQTTSWTTYFSVLESLIWLGIKKYIKENESHFKELKTTGVALSLLIQPPFYKGKNIGLLDFITEKMDNATLEKINSIKGKISNNQDVFHDAKHWLKNSTLPLFKTYNEYDTSNLGKILFWLHQFQINREISFSNYNFNELFEKLPTKYSADFLCGLYFYNDKTFRIWNENKDKFLNHFRIEYNIPLIEQNDKSIKIHFVYQLDDEHESSFHERTRPLIDILRMAIPDKQKYGSQAYGHKVKVVELPYDETHKNIGIDYLPIKWQTKHYSTFYSLIQYEDRPDTWSNIAKNLYENRHRVLSLFQSFMEAMIKYYKTGKLKEIEDYWYSYKSNWYNDDLDYNYLFPKEVIDKWGFTKDEAGKKNEENNNPFLSTVYPMVKAIKDFQQHLSNFFQHSNKVIFFKILNNQYSEKQIHDNKEFFEKQGYNFQLPYLSTICLMYAIKKLKNYQIAFKTYFSKYNVDDFEELEIKETEIYRTMLFMWREFANAPFKKEKSILTKIQRRVLSTEKDIDRKVNSTLSILKSGKSIIDYDIIEDIDRTKTWTVIYCKDFIHVAAYIGEVANSIREKLGTKKLPSIKALVFELDYPDFSIVPLIEDVTVNGVYFQIPLYTITSKDDNLISPITTKRLSLEELQFLNIDKGVDIIPELKKPEQLNTHVQLISFYLNYIAQMRVLHDGDKIARLLVKNLVLQSIVEITKMWKEIPSIISDCLNEFTSQSINPEDIFIPHVVDKISELNNNLRLFGELINYFRELEEELMPFDVIDEWNDKFQEITELGTTVYIYWSSVILDRYYT